MSPCKNYKDKMTFQTTHDKFTEKYQSGEGYKKNSKALNIPQSTARSAIKKWIKYDSCKSLWVQAILKNRVCAREVLEMEATMRPITTPPQVPWLRWETLCVQQQFAGCFTSHNFNSQQRDSHSRDISASVCQEACGRQSGKGSTV